MPFISVQIIRFVDDYQPGWVECEFVDADGCRHVIRDKVPVLTSKDLDADSEYPTPGSVPCEVLKQYQDENGRHLVCVSTDKPVGIETTEGLHEFTLQAGRISSTPD
jgi:hypothetical protein